MLDVNLRCVIPICCIFNRRNETKIERSRNANGLASLGNGHAISQSKDKCSYRWQSIDRAWSSLYVYTIYVRTECDFERIYINMDVSGGRAIEFMTVSRTLVAWQGWLMAVTAATASIELKWLALWYGECLETYGNNTLATPMTNGRPCQSFYHNQGEQTAVKSLNGPQNRIHCQACGERADLSLPGHNSFAYAYLVGGSLSCEKWMKVMIGILSRSLVGEHMQTNASCADAFYPRLQANTEGGSLGP